MSAPPPPARPPAPTAPEVGPSEPAPTAFTRVDALFAGEPPPPAIEAEPRIRKLVGILAVAIPLDLLGITCCTGVPGAILTVWAWLVADEEMTRVEAGEYDSDAAATLLRLRTVSRWAMAFCAASLMFQVYLLSTNFYESLLNGIASMF